jgi:hypothetical protein
MPDEADPYAKVWENSVLNIMWTLAAQLRFEQEQLSAEHREAIERQARAAHFGIITPEIYDRLRDRVLSAAMVTTG